MRNLSAFLTEDVIEYALAFADVPTLRALKGVSLAWRARARRVLCARLCARFGLPLTSILVEVTELTLAHRRSGLCPHTLIPDAVDASLALPNLAKVTWALRGFEVNVAALKCVASSDPYSYPMEGVRACIRFRRFAPERAAQTDMLLAACALRHGEARVPAYAFRSDRSMTSIKLPAGITSLGDSAFEGSTLTSIELPASLTNIGSCAFEASSLTLIELPASLTNIGSSAFCGCEMTSIELPAGISSLGDSAFESCSSLTSIKLSASLTNIGCCAFRNCSSLTSIELPAGITSLGDSAFEDCSSLTSIELPAGLTILGAGTFENCSSLTSIKLPASITSLGCAAFSGCSSLTSIELPAGLTDIGSCSGYPLMHIHKGTFEGCTSLTSMQLPASLTTLGDCAFEGCSSLTSIELPASLPTNIGSCAFRDSAIEDSIRGCWAAPRSNGLLLLGCSSFKLMQGKFSGLPMWAASQ